MAEKTAAETAIDAWESFSWPETVATSAVRDSLAGEDDAVCACECVRDIAEWFERKHLAIDGWMDRPSPWRDQVLRRGWVDAWSPTLRRVARTYNGLAVNASRIDFGAGLLSKIHDSTVGGRDYRTSGVRIGEFENFARPHQIAEQVSDVLRELRASEKFPIEIAIDSHVELVLIHPFADGNGRSTRLLGTAYLFGSGYRSTLTANLESAFGVFSKRYMHSFRDFQLGQISRNQLRLILALCLFDNSKYAIWFRVRQLALESALRQLGADPAEIPLLMSRYDATNSSGLLPATQELLAALSEPLWQFLSRLDSVEGALARRQILRTLDEEMTRPPGS